MVRHLRRLSGRTTWFLRTGLPRLVTRVNLGTIARTSWIRAVSLNPSVMRTYPSIATAGACIRIMKPEENRVQSIASHHLEKPEHSDSSLDTRHNDGLAGTGVARLSRRLPRALSGPTFSQALRYLTRERRHRRTEYL